MFAVCSCVVVGRLSFCCACCCLIVRCCCLWCVVCVVVLLCVMFVLLVVACCRSLLYVVDVLDFSVLLFVGGYCLFVVCVSWGVLFVDRSLLSDVVCNVVIVCCLCVGCWLGLVCVLVGVACCLLFHVCGCLLCVVCSLMDVVCWLSIFNVLGAGCLVRVAFGFVLCYVLFVVVRCLSLVVA